MKTRDKSSLQPWIGGVIALAAACSPAAAPDVPPLDTRAEAPLDPGEVDVDQSAAPRTGERSACVETPEARPSCLAFAATFDPETRFCRVGDDAYGAFPPRLRDHCRRLGGGASCEGERWDRDFLLRIQDGAGMGEQRSVADVLAEIRGRGDLYCRPTPQDREGVGIRFGPDRTPIGDGARSEALLPPFVLGPRRQVDALMRQLYLALPQEVRSETAFVIADRLVQQPEAYAPYIKSRRRVVIAGSFVGIGAAQSVPDWARERHANERWMLRTSIAFTRALGSEVSDVVYAMGDSPSPAAAGARDALEARLRTTLDAAGLGDLDGKLTWGADETVALAFARALPPAKVRVILENPAARQHYDGERRTDEIVREKLPAAGLESVSAGQDFELAVFGRRPGGGTSDWQANDDAQRALDADFMGRFAAYDSEAWSRLAIVDGRLFNGAWDRRAVPPRCDVLAFGSWGTFGNSFGMTAAIAKILRRAPSSVRRTLFVESVAHDVVANGYEEAQRGALRARVDAALGGGAFKHFAGYKSVDTTSEVFRILNALVAERLPAILPCAADDRVRFTPQLWRTFESEVHVEGVPSAAGIFRRDLPPSTFDPRREGAFTLTLEDLIEGR